MGLQYQSVFQTIEMLIDSVEYKVARSLVNILWKYKTHYRIKIFKKQTMYRHDIHTYRLSSWDSQNTASQTNQYNVPIYIISNVLWYAKICLCSLITAVNACSVIVLSGYQLP